MRFCIIGQTRIGWRDDHCAGNTDITVMYRQRKLSKLPPTYHRAVDLSYGSSVAIDHAEIWRQ